MTNDEAKFMLQGYRANGADAADPVFAEALRHAQEDPATQAWFEREQAFDAVISDKLRAVTPPPGLREAILAGTLMTSRESGRVWWRRPWTVGLAAAAAVAVLLAVILTPRFGSQPMLVRIEPVLHLAMADMGGEHGPGAHASALGAFGAWLSNPSSRLQQPEVPIDLDELKAMGCRTVSVGGHEVFEICFKRDSRWYHLYFLPVTACDPAGMQMEPMFHEQGSFVAASWADSQYAYLVAGATDLATLRTML